MYVYSTLFIIPTAEIANTEQSTITLLLFLDVW